ncbi:MAG: hypothetical protein PHN84_04475 [Desulfuromonadaceae bacterium]|nr:hypothetical protein [Desulfuromonadaceae bacterium]
MKTLVKMATLIMVVVSMSGCAGNRNAVTKGGESVRPVVFKEVSDTVVISGKALLKIEFPVKNFKARIAETYIKHSDPPYTVTINIDGQSVELAYEPMLENLPGDFKKNPEVGTGWKYNFRKELQLEAGKHRVTIAVPLSNVMIEKDVTLNEGVNHLQLTPVYKASVVRYQSYPRFNHGLNKLDVKLNAQLL